MNNAGGRQIEPRKVAGYAFAAGMVVAPFLAAIYGWNVGLGLMVLALAASTYLAADALRVAGPEMRQRLKLLAGINAALCLLCLIALLVRALSD